jgi:hypothetical protein
MNQVKWLAFYSLERGASSRSNGPLPVLLSRAVRPRPITQNSKTPRADSLFRCRREATAARRRLGIARCLGGLNTRKNVGFSVHQHANGGRALKHMDGHGHVSGGGAAPNARADHCLAGGASRCSVILFPR